MWWTVFVMVAPALAAVYVQPASPTGWQMGVAPNGRLAAFWDQYDNTTSAGDSAFLLLSYDTDEDVTAPLGEQDWIRRKCTLDTECIGYSISTISPTESGTLYRGRGGNAPHTASVVFFKTAESGMVTFTFEPVPLFQAPVFRQLLARVDHGRDVVIRLENTTVFGHENTSRTGGEAWVAKLGTAYGHGLYEASVAFSTATPSISISCDATGFPFPLIYTPVIDPLPGHQDDVRPVPIMATILAPLSLAIAIAIATHKGIRHWRGHSNARDRKSM